MRAQWLESKNPKCSDAHRIPTQSQACVCVMVLYLVGLGLGDERDITLKGLDAIRNSDRVLLERYTSELGCDKSALEALYGTAVEDADRETVEQNADYILQSASYGKSCSLLVVGDALSATTHTDLIARAKERDVEVNVVHNASIMNAVGVCGLQMYRFGQAVSIVFFDGSWRPKSFYKHALVNVRNGLHTLLLLDIKVKEPTVQALCKGTREYEPPRYMTCAQACQQLLEIEEECKEGVASPTTLIVGLARVGQRSERVCAASIREMADESMVDMGGPVHSLALPAHPLHPIEQESLQHLLVPSSEALIS